MIPSTLRRTLLLSATALLTTAGVLAVGGRAPAQASGVCPYVVGCYAPVNVTNAVSGHDVHLSWAFPSYANTPYAQAILRGPNGFSMRPIADNDSGPLLTSWTDVNVPNGTWYYQVCSVYWDGSADGEYDACVFANPMGVTVGAPSAPPPSTGGSNPGAPAPAPAPKPLQWQVTSEIAWHNATTNETQLWLMHGTQVGRRETVLDESGKPIYVGLPWSIVGMGDFSGDSNAADIVWHNADTGETQVWLMNNTQIKRRETVLDESGKPLLVGLPWSIVGLGSFSNISRTDIAWHNAETNETQVWLMNGTRVKSRQTVLGEDGKPAFVGYPFSIVGVGNVSEQGYTDIVWHNAETGETQLWIMIGTQVNRRQTVLGEDGKPAFVGLPFSIVGVGTNTDSSGSHIVWHNADTGETQFWLMSGGGKVERRQTVFGETGKPAFVGPPFSIVAMGDLFNHWTTLGTIVPGIAIRPA